MRKTVTVLACLALLLPLAARADHHEEGAQGAEAAAAASAKATYLELYDRSAKKLHDLAEAIPEDKYDWRPAEGVRSVKEVVNHVGYAGYFLCSFLGVTPPPEAAKSFDEMNEKEKMGNKAEAIATMDASLAFVRKVAENATPEQLAKQVDFFGMKLDGRGMFLNVHGHMSEHLGQLIAYARMNGVVPPWSAGGGQ